MRRTLNQREPLPIRPQWIQYTIHKGVDSKSIAKKRPQANLSSSAAVLTYIRDPEVVAELVANLHSKRSRGCSWMWAIRKLSVYFCIVRLLINNTPHCIRVWTLFLLLFFLFPFVVREKAPSYMFLVNKFGEKRRKKKRKKKKEKKRISSTTANFERLISEFALFPNFRYSVSWRRNSNQLS